MILTTHILSGAALGASVKNPYAVAGLAVILHFMLDIFPHGDYLNKKSRLREFWKVAVDIAIGLGIVAAVFSQNPTLEKNNIVVGVFFSLIPDGTTFLYIWMKIKFFKPLKDFHEHLHYYKNGELGREFRLGNNLWDVLFSLISLIFLI